MGNRSNMFALATLMVACAVFRSSVAQTTHIVGDSTGWRIPSGGAATYTTWASQQTFTVGDILVFNFATGSHDVAEVMKTAFDSCNAASPVSSTTTAPARITLASAGEHHFICTLSGHCDAGQKLTVTVSGTSTAMPPSSIAAPPSGSAAPPAASTIPSSESPSGSNIPPPQSSSTALVATALPIGFLSLALAFLH